MLKVGEFYLESDSVSNSLVKPFLYYSLVYGSADVVIWQIEKK